MQKLHQSALVLEVDSGRRSWGRADVLVDRFYIDETGQRGGGEIFVDRRPMIVAAGERLPFKDKAFDFVYCCHVVEHAVDIASMFDEMSRVAKAGFIECPNPLLECIVDQELHNWNVTNTGDRLRIAPKTAGNNATRREDRFYFHLISVLVEAYWGRFVTRLSWKGRMQSEFCDDAYEVSSIQASVTQGLAKVQAACRSAGLSVPSRTRRQAARSSARRTGAAFAARHASSPGAS